LEQNLVETDGEADHLHLLVNYPPKVPVSPLVNSQKGVSSRMLKKEHPERLKRYGRGAKLLCCELRRGSEILR
jgi:putative transposase